MPRLSVNVKLGILAAAVVGLFAYQSYAIRTFAAQRGPAVVVTIDIERVFENIKVKANEDARIEAIATGFKNQVKAKDEALKDLEADLDALTPDTAKHRETLEKMQLAVVDYDSLLTFSGQKLDFEQAVSLRKIYRVIKEAAATLANTHGYDIVFVDDSRVEIPQGSTTAEETNRQISARRMLYSSERIDATQELIDHINTQAGG